MREKELWRADSLVALSSEQDLAWLGKKATTHHDRCDLLHQRSLLMRHLFDRLAIAVGCRPQNVVHITDQEPMLALMRQNIALNHLEDHVTAHIYDWGEARSAAVPDHPDIILAADCVYFEPAFPLLQETLQDRIGIETVCYFCYKKRRRADSHFIKAVRKMFLVEEVRDDRDRDAYSRENIFLYICKGVSGMRLRLTCFAGTQLEESLTNKVSRLGRDHIRLS